MASWSTYQSTNGYRFSLQWNDSGKLDPQKTTNKRMKHKLLSYGPFEEPPRDKWLNSVPLSA